MSEKDLCRKCLKYHKNKFGDEEVWPDQHCHHEPKEKEKCWCAEPLNFGITYHRIDDKGININFCPQCGKPLK
jgi:hypothetical protein